MTVGSIAVDFDILVGVIKRTLAAMYQYSEDGEVKELFSEVGLTTKREEI